MAGDGNGRGNRRQHFVSPVLLQIEKCSLAFDYEFACLFTDSMAGGKGVGEGGRIYVYIYKYIYIYISIYIYTYIRVLLYVM